MLIAAILLFFSGCLFFWLAVKRQSRVYRTLGFAFMLNAVLNLAHYCYMAAG